MKLVVNVLWFLSIVSLIGGIFIGYIAGDNALLSDEFLLSAALPGWFGGFASAVVFAALAEILQRLRYMDVSSNKKDNGN